MIQQEISRSLYLEAQRKPQPTVSSSSPAAQKTGKRKGLPAVAPPWWGDQEQASAQSMAAIREMKTIARKVQP